MWQRIDIYKHVCLRPSINADLLQLREKEEQSFTTTNIVESDIDFVAHLPAAFDFFSFFALLTDTNLANSVANSNPPLI
jgi:hypothetical protein